MVRRHGLVDELRLIGLAVQTREMTIRTASVLSLSHACEYRIIEHF